MKKILLLAITILFATVCEAQNTNKEEPLEVDFYGVDFSTINVLGADETVSMFIDAFTGINELLVSEQSKYNVGKYLGLEVLSLQVDHAISQAEKLRSVKFKNNTTTPISLEEIIGLYPTTKNKALLIIAIELDKSTNMGTFIAVVFDGTNKEIISKQAIRGKARGFGLRNFWAGALYTGLKSLSY